MQCEYQLFTWAGPPVLTETDSHAQSQAELPVNSDRSVHKSIQQYITHLC